MFWGPGLRSGRSDEKNNDGSTSKQSSAKITMKLSIVLLPVLLILSHVLLPWSTNTGKDEMRASNPFSAKIIAKPDTLIIAAASDSKQQNKKPMQSIKDTLAATIFQPFEGLLKRVILETMEPLIKNVLDDMTNKMKNTDDKMDDMTNKMKNTDNKMDDMTNKMKNTDDKMDDMTNKMKNMDDKMDDMTNKMKNTDDKMDDMKKNMDEIRKDMDEIKKNMDGIKKNMDGIKKNMDGIKKNTDILIGSSARAQAYKQNSAVLIDRSDGAILNGAQCTWTVFTYQNRYLVVTAKHCALPYDAHDHSLAFVPKTLALSGINRVGFTAGKDSNLVQDDIIIFDVEEKPQGLWCSPMEYLGSNVTTTALDGLVYGRGASAVVEGEQLAKSMGTSVHYVTIVKHQERGNSGTAMYHVAVDGSPNRPIGVWSGTTNFENSIAKLMRPRGYIAPFPNYEDIVWVAPKQQQAMAATSIATNCKTKNRYVTKLRWQQNTGENFVTVLSDPSVPWPYENGIFLDEHISYGGSCDTIDPTDGSMRMSALA
jgi:hypothetical protein